MNEPRPIPTATRSVRRTTSSAPDWQIETDLCVVGAGISGISAALEAARRGNRVVLVDGQATLGGQSVHAIIGTFCGLYSNGPEPYQVTGGIADEILAHLRAEQACHFMRGRRNTCIVQYDEVALQRWIERTILAEPRITLALGSVLRRVRREDRRLQALDLATRYGDVRIEARGFVDASGDASLAWLSGLACREPADGPLYGTHMMVLEGVDADVPLIREEVESRLHEKAGQYGLVRRDGFVFAVPGGDRALVNMTHSETPLDPFAISRIGLEGRAQADRVVAFLRAEFPEALGATSVRAYGQLGVRQTRWIEGMHQLTVDEVRGETRFEDAVLRCSWPIELHDRAEGAYWEVFGDSHLHQVPLGSLLHREADNLVAAGRCIDADVAALSTVRVMGPCIAMGAAAAHALDLAGSGSVHQIDIAALQVRLSDNLERQRPIPD